MQSIQSIPYIGPIKADKLAALQEDTGRTVVINRSGARLVQATEFKSLLDPYEQVENESRLSDCGQLGDAA